MPIDAAASRDPRHLAVLLIPAARSHHEWLGWLPLGWSGCRCRRGGACARLPGAGARPAPCRSGAACRLPAAVAARIAAGTGPAA